MGIEVRQSKYLNKLIEQDHRAIKRVLRPMLGFKSIQGAHAIIAGIKTMHRIKKKQLNSVNHRTSSAADKFYSLAFRRGPIRGRFHPFFAVATELQKMPGNTQVQRFGGWQNADGEQTCRRRKLCVQPSFEMMRN